MKILLIRDKHLSKNLLSSDLVGNLTQYFASQKYKIDLNMENGVLYLTEIGSYNFFILRKKIVHFITPFFLD